MGGFDMEKIPMRGAETLPEALTLGDEVKQVRTWHAAGRKYVTVNVMAFEMVLRPGGTISCPDTTGDVVLPEPLRRYFSPNAPRHILWCVWNERDGRKWPTMVSLGGHLHEIEIV